jgi:hypothetical protein
MATKTTKKRAKVVKQPVARGIDVRVRQYLEAEIELLDKLGLEKRMIVNFPRRAGGRPPMLFRLVLRLMARYGGILDTHFTFKQK